MCGFAGIVSRSGRPVTPAAARTALAALGRRGPDSQSAWQSGSCTLLHCRLRIIDLSARADQPFVAEGHDQRPIVMVYNGEIYNYRQLRDELQHRGVCFHTTSDSEVLLAGYRAWGGDVFRKARGMWAVAFVHPAENRVVLARDPLGKKPLFFMNGADGFCFASNARALLALTTSMPAIDPAGLDCYLAHLAVPFEHSIFAGVEKVPPGATLVWTPSTDAKVEHFWRLPALMQGAPTPAEASSEVERLLRQAVRRRLESDVSLGVFLSAGFDSGLVAAIAAQESQRALVAVTAGTRGWVHDERPAAALVAERYGLEHRHLEVPALSASSLPMLMAELGEPFGDSSILPSFEVARVARREITVALTGDGGDEAFFGYPTFRGVRYAEAYRRWTPGPLRQLLWRATRSVTRDQPLRQLAAVFEYGSAPLWASFRNRMGFSAEERQRLLAPHQAMNGHVAEHIYADRLMQWRDLPDADALRRTWTETHLPNDYLPKVDTATMAASLEARCPFLDVDLMNFALSLPSAVAFPRGERKALLRPLVQCLLPPEILHHPKTGFGVPVSRWMRGSLDHAMEEFVFRRDAAIGSLIDTRVAREFFEAHRRGAEHSARLWGLLSLGVWLAVVVEQRWGVSDALPVGGRT